MQFEHRSVRLKGLRSERWEQLREMINDGWEPIGSGVPIANNVVQWNLKRPIPGTRLVSEMTESELRSLIRDEIREMVKRGALDTVEPSG